MVSFENCLELRVYAPSFAGRLVERMVWKIRLIQIPYWQDPINAASCSMLLYQPFQHSRFFFFFNGFLVDSSPRSSGVQVT